MRTHKEIKAEREDARLGLRFTDQQLLELQRSANNGDLIAAMRLRARKGAAA